MTAREALLQQLSDLQPTLQPEDSVEECTSLQLIEREIPTFPLGICELGRIQALWLYKNKLSYLPIQVSSLTNLTILDVSHNRISFLPGGVSKLTGLTFLGLQNNPMEELLTGITALTNLSCLVIENRGNICIKRIPRGVTSLPCWEDTRIEHHWEMTTSIAEALRRVDLYDEARDFVSCSYGNYYEVLDVDFGALTAVGDGGFGIAYKVPYKGKFICLKVLNKSAHPGTADYEALTKEAELMMPLNHANIIRIYAYGYCNRRVFYAMEYADGQSIWDVLKSSGAMTPDLYIPYALHIASGLKFLHGREPSVEHRDLKPENVLLCDGVAKICDFGISSVREAIRKHTGFKGTLCYAAPENFEIIGGYGLAGDIYAFGLVVWAMSSGQRPYDGLIQGQIIAQKLKGNTPPLVSATPVKMAKLMCECWDLNPRQRPSAADLVLRLNEILRNPDSPDDPDGWVSQ